MIEIPKNVQYILNKLTSEGFEAFVVGDCIRDSLLNKISNDWDIATNAIPKQIQKIFSHTIPTGEQHGTITVIIDNESYEITTYRYDVGYSDHRRPDKVTFASDLKEDLKRRDFTINAMAYNPTTGLIDLFNGQEHLQNCIIKCVGDPMQRLSEDYLRIVRAYRFALTYNFNIDALTWNTCKSLLEANVLKDIAKERLQAELTKMLKAPIETDNFILFLQIFESIIEQVIQQPRSLCKILDQNKLLEIFRVFDNLDFEDRLGWMLFCYCENETQYEEILKGLKYSNEICNSCLNLIKVYSLQKSCKNIIDLKKLIRAYDFNTIFRALNLYYQVNPKDAISLIRLKQLQIIQKENQVVFLHQLAITGHDIISELNIPQGTVIGTMLNDALDAVIEGSIPNTKDEILKYLFYLITKRTYEFLP